MVYIKKLTVQGFKSFGSKRISLELEKGLVVVTGPNGGGKSNIIDAVRFALGELSAHNLRVGKMAELVHDNPSISWARASLTLDNSDRAIPIDSSEVTISRKITRSGESEYHVNGRQVSRNELLMLLSMANIKPSGFNIVPQGSVVEIAEKSGSELRKMLEEVAGISDYEKKKAEAEEQLAVAEKNLAIARAGTKEVKARVKQLERERNQALRRRLVEVFLNSIERLGLEKAISGLEEELKGVDARLLEIENDLRRLEERKKALARERDTLNNLIKRMTEKLNLIDESIAGLDLLRKSKENQINDLKIRESALRERCERLRGEEEYLMDALESVEKKLKEVRSRKNDLPELLNKLGGEVESAKIMEEKRLKELREAEEKYQALKQEVDERLREIHEKRLELEAELARARARKEAIERETNEISSKKEDHVEEGLLEIFKLRKEIENIKTERERIGNKIKSLEKLREEYQRKMTMIEELEQKLSLTLEKLASTGILEFRDESEKILEAVQKAGLKDVKGFLKDAVIADERTLGLLESASDGWLRALVVNDLSLGLKLAKTFSDLGLKLKIIPLNVASRCSKKLKLNGVSYRWRWSEKALAYVLKDVELSPDASRMGEKKIVLNGVMIHPDLRVETISLDKPLLSEIASKEYKESREIMEKLRRELRKLKEDYKMVGEELRDLESEATKRKIEENKLKERLWRYRIQVSEAIIDRLNKLIRFEALKKEREEVEREIREKWSELERFSEPEFEEREELRRMEKIILEKRRLYEEARLKRSELELKIADIWRRIKDSESELEQLNIESAKISERITSARRELAETLEDIKETSRKAKVLEIEAAEAIYGVMILSDLRGKLNDEMRRLSERVRKLSEEIGLIEEEERGKSNVRSTLQIRRAQLEIQLGNLREKLSTVGESLFTLPELEEPRLEELKRGLEEELKELEMINQLAPAQYEELVGNYKLRSSRIAELEAEREEILRFIEWVESEKKRIFMETFSRVAESFEEYFSRLTGGRGWLRVENPESPFEGGIEMILAFPGKQPRSARSASGGEKSVAAVAFLLALQGLTPADFYVFDEVDAHMDLQYSRRLADLFKEMAKRTQIIVISLKDVMVEKADQVVGVYNVGGSSKIVKTKLEEVVKSG